LRALNAMEGGRATSQQIADLTGLHRTIRASRRSRSARRGCPSNASVFYDVCAGPSSALIPLCKDFCPGLAIPIDRTSNPIAPAARDAAVRFARHSHVGPPDRRGTVASRSRKMSQRFPRTKAMVRPSMRLP
jgi:hypothetical protein